MLLNVGMVGRIGGVGVGSGASTGPSLDMDFTGGTLDPRITFTRAAGPATYFDVAGVLQTVDTNVPRFDYDPVTHVARGLLIEETRTNNVRNNTMAGAVAGSPGTLPTNWTIQGPIGPTRTISLGTMNGIPYVDINFAGLTTTSSQLIYTFDVATGSATPAASGQTWSESCFVALIQGDPAVTNMFGGIRATDGATQTEVNNSSGILVLLSASAWYRVAHAFTLVNAGTTNITSRLITASVASGATINFTIRIGLPQLELGAFATSAIPTSTVAATRPADVATMPVGAWFNAGDGTLACDASISVVCAKARTPVSLRNGSAQRTSINITSAGNINMFDTVGPINAGITPELTNGSTWKAAFAFKSGAQGLSVNGGAVTTTAAATLTSSIISLDIGVTSLVQQYCGWISRVRYWPRALSAAELQSATS